MISSTRIPVFVALFAAFSWLGSCSGSGGSGARALEVDPGPPGFGKEDNGPIFGGNDVLLPDLQIVGDPGAAGDAVGLADVADAALAGDLAAEIPESGALLGDGAPTDAFALGLDPGSDPGPTPSDVPQSDFILPTCGQSEVEIANPITPATVLLVMDRSGSMEGKKWEQAEAAVGDVLGVVGPYVRFGLLLFPSSSGCSVGGSPQVGFGLNNGPPIVQQMDKAGTGGSTPTSGALKAAYDLFASQQPPGERIVILATDGQPNCVLDCGKCGCLFGVCGLFCDEDTCAENEARDLVASLLAQLGVKTYVIGIEGSGGAKKVLEDLATLGGTALPGPTKYYEAGDGGQLGQVIADIIGQVGSCSVGVEVPPGYDFVIVEVNGQKMKRDGYHLNGWDLLPDGTLQFYGEACTEVSTAESTDVKVTFICKY